ncbi:MAG: AmmeMemoRadiSam system radical SAM enzyme [Armatimonadota bacterium]|nr:AmmeMemoRadiSam system radical SAM enzyme [Armatimonadota bacterium]
MPTDESVVRDDDLVQLEPGEAQRLLSAPNVREALLYEQLSSGRARCGICLRRCNIPEGKAGYCMTIINVGGKLYTTIYGVVSAAHADPIEKKPVYHYKPGSVCFSVGSLGCNFRCIFCQNWEIAFADAVSPVGFCEYSFGPEQLVQRAIDTGSQGVAWTYNEPGIWLNYTLDSAKLAKQAGLYTCYVTNGYVTPEHLDMIGPYLDIYRVDIKSMADEFYRKLIKVPSVKGILESAAMAKSKWNMHVECVTNVIPGWNDSEENIRGIASWIVENLGELTPWHVTRFFPYAQMQDVPPTPIETLKMAKRVGEECGLKFVYLGNVRTDEGENTYCPSCGKLVVERSGYSTRIAAVTDDGKCAYDSAELNIVIR